MKGALILGLLAAGIWAWSKTRPPATAAAAPAQPTEEPASGVEAAIATALPLVGAATKVAPLLTAPAEAAAGATATEAAVASGIAGTALAVGAVETAAVALSLEAGAAGASAALSAGATAVAADFGGAVGGGALAGGTSLAGTLLTIAAPLAIIGLPFLIDALQKRHEHPPDTTQAEHFAVHFVVDVMQALPFGIPSHYEGSIRKYDIEFPTREEVYLVGLEIGETTGLRGGTGFRFENYLPAGYQAPWWWRYYVSGKQQQQLIQASVQA